MPIGQPLAQPAPAAEGQEPVSSVLGRKANGEASRALSEPVRTLAQRLRSAQRLRRRDLRTPSYAEDCRAGRFCVLQHRRLGGALHGPDRRQRRHAFAVAVLREPRVERFQASAPDAVSSPRAGSGPDSPSRRARASRAARSTRRGRRHLALKRVPRARVKGDWSAVVANEGSSPGTRFLRARAALSGSIDFCQRQSNARQYKLASVVHDAQDAVVAGDVAKSVTIAMWLVGNLPDQFACLPVDNSLPVDQPARFAGKPFERCEQIGERSTQDRPQVASEIDAIDKFAGGEIPAHQMVIAVVEKHRRNLPTGGRERNAFAIHRARRLESRKGKLADWGCRLDVVETQQQATLVEHGQVAAAGADRQRTSIELSLAKELVKPNRLWRGDSQPLERRAKTAREQPVGVREGGKRQAAGESMLGLDDFQLSLGRDIPHD